MGSEKVSLISVWKTIYYNSDHKPLQYISENKPIPALASARIQRWALTLGAYNYKIQYKSGKENSNTDVLSWLPLPESPDNVPYLEKL